MEHMWPTFSTSFKHLMYQWGKCLHVSGDYVVYSFGLAIFTQMLGKVFSLNLALKYVRSSEICVWSTKPNHVNTDHSEMDHVKPYNVRSAFF